MKAGRTWTAEERSQLAAMVNMGLTSRAIAEKFPGRTRNAVIGECHRLGLQLKHRPLHQDPTWRIKSPRKPEPIAMPPFGVISKPIPPRPRSKSEKPAPAPIQDQPVRLEELKDHHCRWPLPGPGRGLDQLFCGWRKADGYSYCPHHCRISYSGWKCWDEQLGMFVGEAAE